MLNVATALVTRYRYGSDMKLPPFLSLWVFSYGLALLVLLSLSFLLSSLLLSSGLVMLVVDGRVAFAGAGAVRVVVLVRKPSAMVIVVGLAVFK